MPNLEEVTLSGVGNITVNDFTNQGDLYLGISGLGKIELNTFEGPEELLINISGSGSIIANSEIPNLHDLEIKFSGSGRPVASVLIDVVKSNRGSPCLQYTVNWSRLSKRLTACCLFEAATTPFP